MWTNLADLTRLRHWWIGGGGAGGPNSFIFMQFSAKNLKNNNTLESWRTPPPAHFGKILDPPLLEPTVTVWICWVCFFTCPLPDQGLHRENNMATAIPAVRLAALLAPPPDVISTNPDVISYVTSPSLNVKLKGPVLFCREGTSTSWRVWLLRL